VHERVANGAFHGLAELRARQQERVDIDAIRIQGEAGLGDLLIVQRDQYQIDVGLLPNGVVREAAAEDCGKDRAVAADLRDQIVERSGELLLDGFGVVNTALALGSEYRFWRG